MELQQESKDAQVYGKCKNYLFTDKFCFYTKGDVIDLPASSIPLDFAYKFILKWSPLHRCPRQQPAGAVDYELKTGDIVDIMTSSRAHRAVIGSI